MGVVSGIEEGEKKSKRRRSDKFKMREWKVGWKRKLDEWYRERDRVS